MTTERRRSPRRKVERIERVGGWGSVRYLHHLECGHAESRPRASSAPKLACAMCLRVGELDKELKKLVTPEENSVEVVDIPDDTGQDEVHISRMTATIANRFGVPADAVAIQVAYTDGRLRATSAYVFLGPNDVNRLGGT